MADHFIIEKVRDHIRKDPRTQTMIGLQYGVSQSTVSRFINGLTYHSRIVESFMTQYPDTIAEWRLTKKLAESQAVKAQEAVKSDQNIGPLDDDSVSIVTSTEAGNDQTDLEAQEILAEIQKTQVRKDCIQAAGQTSVALSGKVLGIPPKEEKVKNSNTCEQSSEHSNEQAKERKEEATKSVSSPEVSIIECLEPFCEKNKWLLRKSPAYYYKEKRIEASFEVIIEQYCFVFGIGDSIYDDAMQTQKGDELRKCKKAAIAIGAAFIIPQNGKISSFMEGYFEGRKVHVLKYDGKSEGNQTGQRNDTISFEKDIEEWIIKKMKKASEKKSSSKDKLKASTYRLMRSQQYLEFLQNSKGVNKSEVSRIIGLINSLAKDIAATTE